MSEPHSPSQPGALQDFLWRIEAFGFDLFTAMVRAMPVDWASAAGGGLLKLLGPLSGAHKTARRNIALAFPDMPEADRRRLLKAQWESVGRTFAEVPIMDRIALADDRIELINGERLGQIAGQKEPVVFVSGHLANWEVMPAAIVKAGVDCYMTYRAANNPYVDKRIKESRARYGIQLFAPKGSDGARDMLLALKDGQSVALMNDQKFNGGVAAPFFGHEARTAEGPSRLAIRFGTVLQPMSVQRTRGARFRVTVYDPIEPPHTEDRTADIEACVRAINTFMEDRIRERPEEWFWVHKRWPNEVYAGLGV